VTHNELPLPDQILQLLRGDASWRWMSAAEIADALLGGTDHATVDRLRMAVARLARQRRVESTHRPSERVIDPGRPVWNQYGYPRATYRSSRQILHVRAAEHWVASNRSPDTACFSS
jgi:hypothetical protein